MFPALKTSKSVRDKGANAAERTEFSEDSKKKAENREGKTTKNAANYGFAKGCTGAEESPEFLSSWAEGQEMHAWRYMSGRQGSDREKRNLVCGFM